MKVAVEKVSSNEILYKKMYIFRVLAPMSTLFPKVCNMYIQVQKSYINTLETLSNACLVEKL